MRPATSFAGVADVVVGTVLGLAHPFAGGLERGAVCGEHVPAARRRPGKPRAGDPVLPGPELPGGETLMERVTLLDHGPVGIANAPPRQPWRVLPQHGHAVGVDQVERVRAVVLRVSGREVEPGRIVGYLDVVDFDRVEPLARAHRDPLAQHWL